MLWFRNALWYRFSPQSDFSESRLIDALSASPFIPCRGAQAKSLGFSSPASSLIEEPVFTSNGFHLIALQSEEKILPSSVINDEVREKVEQLEAEQDRKVYRKEQQQLKEEIKLTLLPRAFSRRRLIRALIAPHKNLIIVDTSSANKADELLNQLRESLGSLSVELVNTSNAPSRIMSQWVTDQTPLPTNFRLGGEAEMRDPLESSSQIKIKGQELTQPDVQAHVNGGMLIERLALRWSEQLEFVLHADLSLKRIKLTEEYQESLTDTSSEDQLAELDADLTRLGLELTALIPDIIDAFGGENRDV